MNQRTIKQNRALHEYFKLFSDELNIQGLDAKLVLKPEYKIWWTPEMIKNCLWKPLQEAMYHKKSTTELTTAQITKVHEQLSKIISEKFGTYVPFPSIEETENYINSLDKINE